MKKNIFKHIFPVVAVMAASGCADDNTTPLTADSAKTPVNIAVAVADAETSGKTIIRKRSARNRTLLHTMTKSASTRHKAVRKTACKKEFPACCPEPNNNVKNQ